MESMYETIRNFETLDKLKRRSLIKKLKDKKLSSTRLIELEKDFRDYLDIQKTLLYLYCNTFEVGKHESPKKSL